MTGRHEGYPEQWYDQPAPLADLTNPEDKPGTASAEQIRALQARFTERGLTGRGAKLAWLAKTLGLPEPPQSSRQLSYSQAARALQALTAEATAKP
jgi:hypothetical protein